MQTYACDVTGVRVRQGESVDPARWAQAQMNDWVDRNIFKNSVQQSKLSVERSWDYYKLGYTRVPVQRDRRLKGWKNWED